MRKKKYFDKGKRRCREGSGHSKVEDAKVSGGGFKQYRRKGESAQRNWESGRKGSHSETNFAQGRRQKASKTRKRGKGRGKEKGERAKGGMRSRGRTYCEMGGIGFLGRITGRSESVCKKERNQPGENGDIECFQKGVCEDVKRNGKNRWGDLKKRLSYWTQGENTKV